ncbi:MAG: transposase [Myxococcales bacterium]|nr:transposase [Myxococcales bacterium]
MRRSYSKSFKEKIKERLLEPGIVKSLLSEETGVPASTLCRWQAQALSLGSMGGKKKAKKRKTQRNWTALQKAQILARASELEGDERGAYLREQGVHPTQLEAWRKALDDHVEANRQSSRRIQQLERELARKEKALAEAAALLVLKKKVAAIYEDADDDTNGPSES